MLHGVIEKLLNPHGIIRFAHPSGRPVGVQSASALVRLKDCRNDGVFQFLNWSQYRLAKEVGVSQTRIGEVISGKRAVTADTDLRLCRLFGLSDGWWLRLQVGYRSLGYQERNVEDLFS